VDAAALAAFERAIFKVWWSCLGFRVVHARFVALRAARSLDLRKISRRRGMIFVHGASLHWRERYRTLCHRKRPSAGGDNKTMRPSAMIRWTIPLTLKILMLWHDLNMAALGALEDAMAELAKPRNAMSQFRAPLAL
jgi:hypothetical protein